VNSASTTLTLENVEPLNIAISNEKMQGKHKAKKVSFIRKDVRTNKPVARDLVPEPGVQIVPALTNLIPF